MILKPYFLACLSHASYLVADESSKTAVVIDPQRDTDGYLEDAKKLGVEVRFVLLTHFHADFVSGHLELRERAGAEISLGARAVTEYPARRLRDGEEIVLGPDVKLRVLETPGHTPESVSYLVFDRKKSETEPAAVFTGDTLFLGDVGRPDLMASKGAAPADLARQLYRSLRAKLLPLPDATLVYPAHGAGSLCGKSLSTETTTSFGQQKLTNWALQEQSEADFVKRLTADLPEAPRYFSFDADLNRHDHATLERALATSLAPLPVDELLAKVAAGAQLLDAREPDEFAKGHLRGAVNVGLGGKYASWAGQVLDARRPIVLVAPAGKEREAALRLGRIGFDQVQGFLAGGPASLAGRSDVVQSFPRIAPGELATRLGSGAPPVVLDVRAESEWRAGHIEGSLNVPLPHLEERLAEIPRGRPVVVQCQSGYRSSIATSLLERAGVPGLSDLAGGIVAWQKAKLATVS